jgi:hypothetical protein
MTTQPDTIEREVWATPAEFRRGLELAFPAGIVDDGDVLHASYGKAAMAITLEVLAPRTIALLAMPRLQVTLRRAAGTPADFTAMIARMDLAMHRGGG